MLLVCVKGLIVRATCAVCSTIRVHGCALPSDPFNDWEGRGCNKFVQVLGGDGTKIAPIGDIFDQLHGGMISIRGKFADHVGDHVVLSPEGAVLVTFPGTESSYPRPLQSLNNSSLCMVVRPRYLFTNTYISLRALLCMRWYVFHQRTRLCCLDVVCTRNSLFLSLKANKRIP